MHLCKEITLYGQLKSKWGLGNVKCVADFMRCGVCVAHHTPILVGYYVNEENVKKDMFLGYGFQQALARVDHVKSLL